MDMQGKKIIMDILMGTQGKESSMGIQGNERIVDIQGKESSMGIQEKEDITGAQEKGDTVGAQGEGRATGTQGEGSTIARPGEGSAAEVPGEGGSEWNETRKRIETMRGLCGAIVDRLDQLADYQRARGRLTLRDPFCRVVAEAIWALAMAVEARAHENLNAARRADARRAAGGDGCPGDGER